jgi:hypothetical protein
MPDRWGPPNNAPQGVTFKSPAIFQQYANSEGISQRCDLVPQTSLSGNGFQGGPLLAMNSNPASAKQPKHDEKQPLSRGVMGARNGCIIC